MQIQYRTVATKTRQGPWGHVAHFIAAHPVLSGIVGGLLAVGIAFARASGGALKMPEIAAAISGVVILVWVVLFYMMRGFFASQTTMQVDVVRRIETDQEGREFFRWSEEGEVVLALEPVTWSLERAEGAPKRNDMAWPLFLVATGPQGEFVLETRGAWDEVRTYPITAKSADEILPAHVASELLGFGRQGS